MNINKLAIVYVRVSTQYQIDNYSVQGQRDLTYLAARYGVARVETREEQDVSAETITARPVMKVILEEIAKGIIGALIVSSFTRLTRDMDDIDGALSRKRAAKMIVSLSLPKNCMTLRTKPMMTSPTCNSFSRKSKSA